VGASAPEAGFRGCARMTGGRRI